MGLVIFYPVAIVSHTGVKATSNLTNPTHILFIHRAKKIPATRVWDAGVDNQVAFLAVLCPAAAKCHG
ncbi:hypothetical protein NT6N_15240 [Oceaniferula spumae]|uniref:Uncharacterized protein n=1 Tax=Oceaniferula spumae TaxID=2979115 RepID=A0AAT9FKK0_9BACT